MDNKTLRVQIEAEKERIRHEKLQKRCAYEAICALTDTVDETELQRHLSVLDPCAWCEVVEERFLARLCGFPLCDQPISVDFRKAYTIVRRQNVSTGKERKMILPTESEPVKFCSDRCMGKSRAIAVQLNEQRKQFQIPKEDNEWMPFVVGKENEHSSEAAAAADGQSSTTSESVVVQTPKFGVELVTKLHALKLADAAEEPIDGGEEEEQRRGGGGREEGQSAAEDSESEERLFVQQLKAFVTTKQSSQKSAVAGGDSSKNGTKKLMTTPNEEWKRGFLLVPPSSPTTSATITEEMSGTNSSSPPKCRRQRDERREGVAAAEVEHRNSNKVGKSSNNNNTLLVGEVIERMAPGATKERSNKMGKGDAKKKPPPQVVEAPRISADQVRQTL